MEVWLKRRWWWWLLEMCDLWEPGLAGGHYAAPYCRAPQGWGISTPALPRSANDCNKSCFHTLRQATELWYCCLWGGKRGNTTCLQCMLMTITPGSSITANNHWVDRHILISFPCHRIQSSAASLFTRLMLSVIDNKAAEIGSTLFKDDIYILTQSSRGEVGCSSIQHLSHILYVTRTNSFTLLSCMFHCGKEISVHLHLRGHMVELAHFQAPASICLTQRLFGNVCLE